MKLRILVTTVAAFAVSVPAAHAEALYAGTAVRGTAPVVPSFSLVVRDNGTVRARLVFPYSCRGHRSFYLRAYLNGRANGAAFTATGSTNGLRGAPRIRFTLTGTLAADGGTGKIRLRARGCRGYTRSVVLRTPSAPAGAPAIPAPNSLLIGFTSQKSGGTVLPVILRVAKNGRVYAIWHASVDCGPGNIQRVDLTPTRKINPDGTFGGTQRYRIRYSDGTSELYRVSFKGRFLAGGATGTLRMTVTEKGYKPCVTGTQTWAAR